MCKFLNVDTVLATALIDAERVTFGQLREFSKRISLINAGVVFAYSSESLQSVLDWYPEIFQKDDDAIKRADEFDKYQQSDYLRDEFLDIPENLAACVSKCWKEVGIGV